MQPRRLSRCLAFLALAGAAAVMQAGPSRADEGMWLFNKAPTQQIKDRYGVELSDEWLEHVRKSSVRFNTGGSGSLVSATGLVMTNHHVASDMLAKLSTPEKDLMALGFLAASPADELPCPDLELDILWTIEDVTDQVNQGITDATPAAEAFVARRKNIAAISDAYKTRTGLEAEVVTLYQGGKYHLYGYRRFTDVRLVMAPEKEIAFFGGDTDNFEYPRFCLDVTFFRIYDNGQPLRPEHYLKWSTAGAGEGDPIFVSGHPGSTRRLFTTDHLAFRRDVQLPTQLSGLWRAEVKFANFMARSEENRRIAEDDFFGIQNSRKVVTGQLAGLHDPALMGAKAGAEEAIRSAVAKNPEWAAKWGDAWDTIATAQKNYREFFLPYGATEGMAYAGGSQLMGKARTLVRLADEKQKPSGERLPGYRDSDLESTMFDLLSPAPIYNELETFKIASGLSLVAERLGADHPVTRQLLGGQSPRARAEALIAGTTLQDVEARRKLAEGGTEAIANSSDTLIRLARELDAQSRAYRKQYEDTVQALERQGYAKIAQAKFAAEGDAVYPDATFTLRLSYGSVKGYTEEGQNIPAFTTLAGLYERAAQRAGQDGFALPESWLQRKGKLNLSTPFNFVCTADIIGGNSGSPVVNAKGEVVGLVFDGNIHSLSSDVAYSDTQSRCLAVDARGILEALKSVYNATALVNELTAR